MLHHNPASLRGVSLGDAFNADLAADIGGALSAVRAGSPAMIPRRSGTILPIGRDFTLAPDSLPVTEHR